jgi:hypothetical protein
MAEHGSDYHRGDMDIREQVSTYNLIMGFTKWGSLAIAAVVLFLTMWFSTNSGFLGALAATVLVIVVGVLLLREKRKAPH